jgi:ribosomal RNA-processing protein 7
LSQFNRAESARNRVRKYQRSIPDEDGFVTVTRGGRAGPARLEEAEKKKAELEERRKSKGIKDDFYRFQTREKKKEAEGELRRKFELDKKRIEEMRARRGKIRPET